MRRCLSAAVLIKEAAPLCCLAAKKCPFPKKEKRNQVTCAEYFFFFQSFFFFSPQSHFEEAETVNPKINVYAEGQRHN